MKRQSFVPTALPRISLLVILCAVCCAALVRSENTLLAAAPAPLTQVRMMNVFKQWVLWGYSQGMAITPSGSCTKSLDEKYAYLFRDPLTRNPPANIDPSDFDSRISVTRPVSNDVAVQKWKDGKKKLVELIEKEFGKEGPAAVDKIKAVTKLYPPNQVVEGLENSAEALERMAEYGEVPGLQYAKLTTKEIQALDPHKAVEGVYGAAGEKYRSGKEVQEGLYLYSPNGKDVVIAKPSWRSLFETGPMTAKSTAGLTEQWLDYAEKRLNNNDPALTGKYMDRAAEWLRKTRVIGRYGSSPLTEEMSQMALRLKGMTTIPPLLEPEVERLLAQAKLQSGLIRKLESTTEIADRIFLQKFLKSVNGGSTTKLGSELEAAAGKVSWWKVADGVFKIIMAWDAVNSHLKEDYQKEFESIAYMWGFGAGQFVKLFNEMFTEAQDAGFVLTASRQSCDSLLAGIFVPGANPEATPYTIQQLVDTIHDEVGLSSFVGLRSQDAADRGFQGPAVEKLDWGTGDAIYNKCYPVILENWNAGRDAIASEYEQTWSNLVGSGVVLAANPNPAYLDKATKKVTVTVTGYPVAGEQPEEEKKLAALAQQYTGVETGTNVPRSFNQWSPGGEGKPGENTQRYTFTRPGLYVVSATYDIYFHPIAGDYSHPLSKREKIESEVQIEVLDPDEKPACDGRPWIVSAKNTTVQPKKIPVAPGQIGSPQTILSTSGSFAEKPQPCDPDVKLGPYFIGAGGTIRATIESPQKVPETYSILNANTDIHVDYRPWVGQNLGKSDSVPGVEKGSGGENAKSPYHIVGDFNLTGAGHLFVTISAPRGFGAGQGGGCYSQSYTARVDLVSINAGVDVNGETSLRGGDRVVTGGGGEAILIMPNGDRFKLGPNTEVLVASGQSEDPRNPCQTWGLSFPKGNVTWASDETGTTNGTVIRAGSQTIK